ncbi:Phosphomethylpyrimidine synthase [Gossypium arboreum]|uniref:Phosphomethylpyrimidine synthase n=1 Tax=Gossypium arboreum TaxID=29729 RepID=A0A0B0NAA6_GOSAR|nr:Phosphomethylpyrimidine synthase [Gossypium arboreum]
MCHALYSIKKANLTVKEYLAKVKSLSDSLIAAGSPITKQELVSIILVGLSMEYESIRVLASATPTSLDLLTEMLLDCETRQIALLTEVPLCSPCYQPHASYSHQSSRPSFTAGSDQAWYPDSSATNHITPNMTPFTNVALYTGTSLALTAPPPVDQDGKKAYGQTATPPTPKKKAKLMARKRVDILQPLLLPKRRQSCSLPKRQADFLSHHCPSRDFDCYFTNDGS